VKFQAWDVVVSDSDPGIWKVAHDQPLFTATDGVNPQPITIRPEAGIHPSDTQGLMIYIGTGKYLEPSDQTTAIPAQTVYGIWDKNDGTAPSITRSDLLRQEVIATPVGERISSDYEIDWTQHYGWYR
jgi:type IV pilus assembly protein PilY1